MAVRCSHCNESTVWDDAVGSSVCTSCGSLEDPSQSVLTSSQYENATEPSLWDPSASTTLKSLRVGTNWDLAGQGKEARDRKNAYALADFIKSLAVSFNATGLSPRAITLFTQAKAASNFRWGHKSRSVAAACLAIALREANRPDSIRDIASILNVPAALVSREFTSITSTLKLSLNLVDPSVHIATLQNHLGLVLQAHQRDSQLPVSLVASLQTICLRSTARTATSLSQLLARLSPDNAIQRLPVAPTACGIFMLALEAENRAILNPLGDLAQCLGSSCHAAKSIVMGRYKTVQDEIARWIDNVPWLDKYDNRNGRAKVPKRLVVARGLTDVIKFQEDIWQRQIKHLLDIDLHDAEDEKDDQLQSVPSNIPPKKRPKLNHTLTQTARFLLDPTACSLSSTVLTDQTRTSPANGSGLSLATYILTNPSTSYTRRLPSRLQLLAQDRGGTSKEHIPDEELFLPGEFEGWLRNDEEIKILRHILGWSETGSCGGHLQTSNTSPPRTNKRKRTRDESTPEERPTDEPLTPRKKSRINMEALARFLADNNGGSEKDSQGSVDNELLGLEEVMSDCDFDDDDNSPHNDDYSEVRSVLVDQWTSVQQQEDAPIIIEGNAEDDGELILEGWRPPSPEVAEAWYEEEYD